MAYPMERVPGRAFIELDGNPVRLKQLEVSDAAAMLAAINYDRPHLQQFGDDTADKYQSVEDIIRSIENPNPKAPEKIRFGIWDNDTLVGSINLRPSWEEDSAELGYWIGKEFVGHGYAAYAAELAVKYAFQTVGLGAVFARTHPDNQYSQNVLRKAGFERAHSAEVHTFIRYRPDTEAPLKVQTLYEDSYGSVAAIALNGANVTTINHGSDTRYAVTSGGAMFWLHDEPELVFEGESIFVPRGMPYSDAGEATMVAVSMPPFDPAKVERLN